MTKALKYNVRTMKLTTAAKNRLKHLLPREADGFSVTGYMGTCRGSTPILKPADGPVDGQETMLADGIRFFVNPDIAEEFRDCEMDHDPSLFGKGLTATWPHRSGCACNHG
jgi:Fe-S cluster assembly iron-binding protein IscA